MGEGWTIGQFIVGMLIAGVGFVVVWQSDWLLRNFGTIPFAEKFLQTEGGSRLFYKLIGVFAMIIGMMHATALLAPTAGWIIKKMFGSYFTVNTDQQSLLNPRILPALLGCLAPRRRS